MAVLGRSHDASDPKSPVGGAWQDPARLPEVGSGPGRRASGEPRHQRIGPLRARPGPQTTTTLVGLLGAPREGALPLRGGSERDLEVDPRAVRVTPRRWYLLCWCEPSTGPAGVPRRPVLAVDVQRERFPPRPNRPGRRTRAASRRRLDYSVEVVIEAPFDAVDKCVPRTLHAWNRLTTRVRHDWEDPAIPGIRRNSSPRLPAPPPDVKRNGGADTRDSARRTPPPDAADSSVRGS